MKNIFILIFAALTLVNCSHYAFYRGPSSVPKGATPIGKGMRLTLKQPMPFMNTEKKKRHIAVTSRKKFTSGENTYACAISISVGKQDTFFVPEGTVYEFADKNPTGENTYFQNHKGPPMILTCNDTVTGMPKSFVTMEEAQMAFPPDVLVLERDEMIISRNPRGSR